MRIIAIKRITLVANLLMLVTAVRAQYTNPVLNKDMPDPSVVRAPDGQFYVYATEGGGLCVPIYRSRDLATRWRFAGSAFNSSTRPTFIKGGTVVLVSLHRLRLVEGLLTRENSLLALR